MPLTVHFPASRGMRAATAARGKVFTLSIRRMREAKSENDDKEDYAFIQKRVVKHLNGDLRAAVPVPRPLPLEGEGT
jgi:hypothetical protein